MITRLLIIITRMYATKCGEQDEFTQFWATAEQEDLTYLLFKNIAGAPRCYVLVLHGFEYPDTVNQQVIDRACQEVTASLSEIKAQVSDWPFSTGLAFHPHPSWIDIDTQPLSQALQSCLEASGMQVEFVDTFMGGIFEKTLAPQCRAANADFSAAFDSIWNPMSGKNEEALIIPPAPAITVDYARQLGLLKHELTHLLQPIDIDLQGWEQSDFNSAYGLEIIACYRNDKAKARLLEAQQVIQGDDSAERESVLQIVSHAKEKAAGRAQAIQDKWSELDNLFKANGFIKAATLLAALGEAKDAPDNDLKSQAAAATQKSEKEILARLRGLLEAGNDFHQWYVEIETKLSELRNLLS